MKIYGIFGDPIEHSLSPAMHNAAFSALDLDACYHAFRVSKDRLSDAIVGAEAMGFGGLNLTIPHKEMALEIVKPDETALAVGAVNTISFRNGIMGYDTDGEGALLALEKAGARINGSRVLIIGAGGAAKAIAHALAGDGAKIAIVNRSLERAAHLADSFGGEAYGLDSLERLAPGADIIINATSLGMKEGDQRLLKAGMLHEGQTVFDIVYNRPTELLMDAARAHAMAIDGIMMLVYQGARAFEIWTGMPAPVDVMERAVRDGLKARDLR
jgi:shikimate dehydrogenase